MKHLLSDFKPQHRNSLLGLLTVASMMGSFAHAADIIKNADITANETWTADNNYVLSRPVVVKAGVTLTIEPGTKVLGVGDNKGTSDRTDDEYGSLIIARGAQLIADGTPTKPIIFDAYASVYGFDDNGRNTGPSGPRTQTLQVRGVPQIQTSNDNGTGTPENPNGGATPAAAGSPLKSGGLWGGLIVLGRAPINFYNNTGNVQQSEKIIEGFPVSNVDDLRYGATSAAEWIPNDNSGVIRYVSLRFGGYEFQAGSEINGLTLGAVGNGTKIEYVEVVSNNDDGFEFFGGTVNTKYLVSAFNKDDSFDIDEGHQGKHQFWFAIQNNTSTAIYGDNGLELDGGFSINDLTNNLAPFTTPDIYNMTVIGKGLSEAANAGARMRDNFKGKIHNSLFTELGTSLRADATLDAAALPVVNNTVFGNIITTGTGTYRVNSSGSSANANTIASTPTDTNTVPSTTAMLTSISRTPNGNLDPRPLANSTPLTHTRTTPNSSLAEVISTVNYNGAFGRSLWVKNWTYLDEKGYLPADTTIPVASRTTVQVSTDITASTTWTADNIYVINRPIVVKAGVTLTIEPGTLILGVGDNKGTSDRTDDEYGSLIIARGAQLIADGTPTKPIIFDAYASVYGFDDNGRNTGPSGPRTQTLQVRGVPQIQTSNDNGTGTPENPNGGATPAAAGSPLKSGGLWGGLIVLGRAPINFYNNTGNVQQSEKIIEGFPVSNVDDLRYGATSAAEWIPNDNSGVIRYVSLRFGGYEFQAGSEINGLTLGAVGNGTKIEYVEVVSNNDDGFEFFGGTVNTKYLVSAFNKDDSFDIDEGHQGKHQFWFAIQNNTSTAIYGDNGLELDGGFSINDLTNNLAPFTTPDIYNMTVIGKGLSEAANAGARMRDNFKGKIHNSLFTELGTSLRADATLDAAALPVVNNTVFGNIITTGTGTYRVNSSGSSANANTIASTPTDTNTVPSTTAMLTSISRTPNGNLDPRPLANSTPLTHTRTTPNSSLAEILATVNYNGAFGRANWANGWSFLSEKGYFNQSTSSDTVAPVITLLGANPLVINVGSSFVDPGASVSDNVDSTRNINGTGSVNTNVAGSYTVSYNAVDAAGNAATTVTRTVNVVATDTVAPVITLLGANPLIINAGGSLTDPGATVTDNVDAPRTISGNSNVNVNVPGNYTITYQASDAAGNQSSVVTRNVVVTDTSANFVTSTGSPLNITNYFQTGVFANSTVSVIGRLPAGMTFNPTSKLITGYPRAAGVATFNVTIPGRAPFVFTMNFAIQPVPAAFVGIHSLHTDQGDLVTITVNSTAAATVSIQSASATRAVSATGLAKYNSAETNPNRQWTIDIPVQQLAVALPTLRTLKESDGSFLGNYGTIAGKTLWGFKSSNSSGTLVLSKGSAQVTIVGTFGASGSVTWRITPAGARTAITATGRVSADGIANIRAVIPNNGLLIGMLRVDEEMDQSGNPTGQLSMSLLQGFDGWTPVSFTPQ